MSTDEWKKRKEEVFCLVMTLLTLFCRPVWSRGAGGLGQAEYAEFEVASRSSKIS